MTRLILVVAIASSLVGLSACKRAGRSRGGPTGAAITVAGSTSVEPFVEKWAEVFDRQHPDAQINVQGGGSTAGIRAATSGAAQIGTVSRDLTPAERGLNEIVVARDGIAVIVNRQNPVSDLSLDRIRAIFAGQTKNWKDVGGADKAITVITREEGSGTRSAFEELALHQEKIASTSLVQDSTGAVREMVQGDPAAIGYISLGQVNEQVKALRIEGVEATEANVVAKKYPLVRPFLFVTRGAPQGITREFIDFVLSPEGQDLIRKEGLIPAK